MCVRDAESHQWVGCWFFCRRQLYSGSLMCLFSSSSQARATGTRQKTCRDTDTVTRYGLNDDADALVALPHRVPSLGTLSRFESTLLSLH